MRRWLVLLAHQDDEIVALPAIRGLAAQSVFKCVYLTDGAGLHGKTKPDRRNAESLRVLARLGIRPEQVEFAGSDLSIPDGRLIELLDKALAHLGPELSGSGVTDIATLAWEGGHPDHDATHLLALALAKQIGARVWTFPLYNGHQAGVLPFRVMTECALGENPERWQIRWRDRLEVLRSPLSYPSQWRSMLGLYLPMLWVYWTRGSICLDLASAQATGQRPHQGPLLYERRKWMTFDQFEKAIANFRTRVG